MTFIKDTFFGGAEKKAAKAQTQALEKGQVITREGTERARSDLFNLFPAAQQNIQQGFQGALDVFGQSLPAQADVFQQGNVAAQQQLLAGLPQFQNAILGGNVDFSQLQPTQLQQPDLSFFQQQLPQLQAEPNQPLPPLPPQFNPFTAGNIQLGRALGGRLGGGLGSDMR